VSVKIVKNLSIWFEKNQRDLPWRAGTDPYRIWLSEVMLQQTQVATVLSYYDRFLKAFPKIQDLAAAPEDQVFQLWAGLGYYSRARNLHRGAKAIAKRIEEGRGFPSNRLEWLEIPGVGAYTAGAVCSIALNQREPIVDGNVVRVLTRIYSISKMDTKKTEIWDRARALVEVPNAKPRVLNQALMELGAMVCRPKNPDCLKCPVRSDCSGKNDVLNYPPKKAPKEWKRVQERRWVVLFVSKNGVQVLLRKNNENQWRSGLWDFMEEGAPGMARATLMQEFKLNYVVTHHKVERHHRVLKLDKPNHSISGAEWFDLETLPGIPAPALKALSAIKKTIQTKGTRKSLGNAGD